MRAKSVSAVIVGMVLALVPGPTSAAPQSAEAAPRSAESYDEIWNNFANWYDNDTNPGVQSVQFSGRFQYEYAAVDGDHGSHSEWNVRRMRLGVKTRFLEDFTFHAEADFNPEEADPFYKRITDFYLEWRANDSMALTFGKQSVPFTNEGSTSSKELLTIDRSNLANNMWFSEEYMPGISLEGTISNWQYHVGAFSAGEKNREFGRFSGSVFTLATLGYDFKEQLGVNRALLRGNYIYQTPDKDNTFTRQLHHMTSIHFDLDMDRWGIHEDLSMGSGHQGQSDLWGLMTMPYVNVTQKFQVVGRHTYLTSDGPNGVRLARYEKSAVAGRGDQYNEWYLGANYFFYGHKLKFQTGVAFGDMDDIANDGGEYNGVAATAGLRVSW
jgi:phosphate-selective porin OprO/OprP